MEKITMFKVSMVMPVLNEEENLEKFYAGLSGLTDDIVNVDWEFIFVDDGSTDHSVLRLKQLRGKDERIKVLSLSRNFGSHAALAAGLSYASGDAAIIMSVDGQDPMDIIPKFLEEWQKGNHVVWGMRETRDDPWAKTLFATAFYRICRKIAIKNYPKGGLDCSLFDRRVIDEYLKINERQGFIFATVLWMGFRQNFVPYHRLQRMAGVSKWSFTKRLKAAIDLLVSFSYFPIRFISYIGIGVSALAFLYGLELIIQRIFFGIGGPGWSSIMVVVLFLGGLQLTMMGVLGEYIWRGTDEVKGRPRYLVMDEIGFKDSKLKGKSSE